MTDFKVVLDITVIGKSFHNIAAALTNAHGLALFQAPTDHVTIEDHITVCEGA